MADYETILAHAKPEWPEEWRFRVAEVCKILQKIETRSKQNDEPIS